MLHVGHGDLDAVVLDSALARMQSKQVRVVRQSLGEGRDLTYGILLCADLGALAARDENLAQLRNGHSWHFDLDQRADDGSVLADQLPDGPSDSNQDQRRGNGVI